MWSIKVNGEYRESFAELLAAPWNISTISSNEFPFNPYSLNELCELIRGSSQLNYLHITNSHLNDSQMVQLISAMSASKSRQRLTSLSFRGNSIRSQTLQSLCYFIATHRPNIHHLDIGAVAYGAPATGIPEPFSLKHSLRQTKFIEEIVRTTGCKIFVHSFCDFAKGTSKESNRINSNETSMTPFIESLLQTLVNAKCSLRFFNIAGFSTILTKKMYDLLTKFSRVEYVGLTLRYTLAECFRSMVTRAVFSAFVELENTRYIFCEYGYFTLKPPSNTQQTDNARGMLFSPLSRADDHSRKRAEHLVKSASCSETVESITRHQALLNQKMHSSTGSLPQQGSKLIALRACARDRLNRIYRGVRGELRRCSSMPRVRRMDPLARTLIDSRVVSQTGCLAEKKPFLFEETSADFPSITESLVRTRPPLSSSLIAQERIASLMCRQLLD